MPFTESFLLLQQEAYLVRTSLAQGLTLLRSANLDEKGHYYGAFFGLSVGLERLLKVVIILDHMAQNELAPPSRSVLKKHGHDLVALFSSARSIQTAGASNPLVAIAPDSIEAAIVSHLSDFAEACGRYANLDALATGSLRADPLSDWKAIIQRILDDDVPPKKKERAAREASVLASALSDSARVVAHDVDKQPLSLQQWFELPRLYDLAAGRAVVRVFRVLCPLKALLEDANLRVTLETQRRGLEEPLAPPAMYEFLDFVWPDERLNQRKKKWP